MCCNGSCCGQGSQSLTHVFLFDHAQYSFGFNRETKAKPGHIVKAGVDSGSNRRCRQREGIDTQGPARPHPLYIHNDVMPLPPRQLSSVLLHRPPRSDGAHEIGAMTGCGDSCRWLSARGCWLAATMRGIYVRGTTEDVRRCEPGGERGEGRSLNLETGKQVLLVCTESTSDWRFAFATGADGCSCLAALNSRAPVPGARRENRGLDAGETHHN